MLSLSPADIVTKLRMFLYLICGLFGGMHVGSLVGLLRDKADHRLTLQTLLEPGACGFMQMGPELAWTWLLEQALSRTAPAPLPHRSRTAPAPLPHRSRTAPESPPTWLLQHARETVTAKVERPPTLPKCVRALRHSSAAFLARAPRSRPSARAALHACARALPANPEWTNPEWTNPEWTNPEEWTLTAPQHIPSPEPLPPNGPSLHPKPIPTPDHRTPDPKPSHEVRGTRPILYCLISPKP